MTDLTLADQRLLAWHTFPCRSCLRPVGQRCRTSTGATTVPHAPRMDDIRAWLTRQPEVDELKAELDRLDTALEQAGDAADLLRQDISDRDRDLAALKLQVGTLGEELRTARAGAALVPSLRQELATLTTRVADLRDQVSALEAYKAAHPDTPPPHVIIEPPNPVPADAVYVDQNGNDNNPGTAAKPRRTPLDGRHNVGQGKLDGFVWRPKAGTVSTLAALPGKQLLLSGGGTLPRAIEASGRINLLDLVVDGYAPMDPKSSFTSAAVYLGGTSAGSVLDGVTFSNSKMGHLSIAVPDVVVRRSELVDAGHYGMLAATADRLLVEDVHMARLNRSGYDPETQAAAGSKVTWSDSVTYRRVSVEDAPGAYGLWWDASCTRTKVIEPVVDGSGVGGRAPMVHCIELEKSDGGLYDGVQHYTYVLGGSTKGAKAAGIMIRSSGFVRVWGGEHHGNGWADVFVQQDTSAPRTPWSSSGPNGDPKNRDPKTSPWTSVGVELLGVGLDKLWVYDDGKRLNLKPEQMVTRLAGLRLKSPTIRWGLGPERTPAQVGATLAGGIGATSPALPADLASLI